MSKLTIIHSLVVHFVVQQTRVSAEFWKTVLLKAAVTSTDVLPPELMSVCHGWCTIVCDIEWKERCLLLFEKKKEVQI